MNFNTTISPGAAVTDLRRGGIHPPIIAASAVRCWMKW